MAPSAFPSTYYVLGTARDSGKTVASMGLIARLLSPSQRLFPQEIGYLKPVAQHVVRVTTPIGECREVERDAALVTRLMGIDRPAWQDTNPVIWRRGATAACVDDACGCGAREIRASLLDRIVACYERVVRGRRAVIIEGTGQMGVGSVGGVSSADIIARLIALGVPLSVLLVVRGESVEAIDRLFPYVVALRHLGLPLNGVIVNRIAPERLPEVRSLLETYYERVFPALYGQHLDGHTRIKILGFVPEITDLARPSLRFVVEQFEQQSASRIEILSNSARDAWTSRLVRRTMVLSLTSGYESMLQDGDLVVVGANAEGRIAGALEYHQLALREGKAGLSGLFLSCRDLSRMSPALRTLVTGIDLPVFSLRYDSAHVLETIDRMEIKIQPYETGKRDLISRAYCAYVDCLPGLPCH